VLSLGTSPVKTHQKRLEGGIIEIFHHLHLWFILSIMENRLLRFALCINAENLLVKDGTDNLSILARLFMEHVIISSLPIAYSAVTMNYDGYRSARQGNLESRQVGES
jgi:hypothetical protein